MEKYTHSEKYTVPATAVAKFFNCGFRPKYIKVFNITGNATLEHIDTMDAASGYKILTGIDDTADTVSLHGQITSDGITISDMGFTLGLDTDINVAAEVLHIVAHRL